MIKKAIVLAAGKGNRLRPLTLAMPKEMVRVGTKPVIEHVISVLKAGGIKNTLIVVGRKKEAIMDYLGSGERWGLDLSYKIQEKPKGTAHAVSLGKNFIDDEDFVVMYGDNYLKPYDAMTGIVKFHKEKGGAGTLVLHPVKDPRRFGIAKIGKDGKVLRVIEKPTSTEAKPYETDGEYLNIAGLMILNPVVFDFIAKTKPGKQGEVWLTDSIKLMMEARHKIYGYVFKGARFDIGTFESLLEADRLEQGENKS
jgi:dTDP-glucose pyrophosphorylase